MSTTSRPAPRRPFLRRLLRAAAALACGAMTALAFPPVDLGNLVWVALLPLLCLLWLAPGGFWRGFRTGWLWGMGFFSATCSWIVQVGYVFFIPLPVFIALAFLPLMAFYALLPALWCGVMNSLLRPHIEPLPEGIRSRAEAAPWARRDLLSTLRSALGGGALWVCIEWLRAHGTLAFSWNSLGTALYSGLSLVQWAEFVGTAALSFLPVATNIILWGALRRSWLQYRRLGSAAAPWDFYGAVVVLFALFAGGLFLSKAYAPGVMLRREGVQPLPVLALQENIDQRERIASGGIDTSLYGRYLRATHAAYLDIQRRTAQRALQHRDVGLVQQLPLWVVWPESALGSALHRDLATGELLPDPLSEQHLFGPDALPRVRADVRAIGGLDFVLFTGADEVLWSPDEQGARYVGMHNNMAVFPEGRSSALTAAKQHLMPFGEYIPFVENIRWLGDIYTQLTGTQVGSGILPGSGSEPLAVPLPGTDESVSVIPAVCYEDTVGDLLRRFARPGAQIIVNVTNDAWFRGSACSAQQARNAAFRCIELRRPMVRAANMGHTCAIAPNGAVIDCLLKADGSPKLAGYSYAVLPVDRRAGLTLYALAGDWAVLLCALLAAALAARRRTTPPCPPQP